MVGFPDVFLVRANGTLYMVVFCIASFVKSFKTSISTGRSYGLSLKKMYQLALSLSPDETQPQQVALVEVIPQIQSLLVQQFYGSEGFIWYNSLAF
jgi:hypothetical protein